MPKNCWRAQFKHAFIPYIPISLQNALPDCVELLRVQLVLADTIWQTTDAQQALSIYHTILDTLITVQDGQLVQDWSDDYCRLLATLLNRLTAITESALLTETMSRAMKTLRHCPLNDWREQLRMIRANTSERLVETTTDQTLPTVAIYSAEIRQWIITLIQNITALIGKPPCDYTVLSLGSLARDVLSAHSDLEFGALLGEPFAHVMSADIDAYFTHLFTGFELAVICLGETPLSDLPMPEGLCFDSGGNTPLRKRDELLATPNELVRVNFLLMPGSGHPCDLILANAVQEAGILYSYSNTDKLYEQYRQQIDSALL